MLWFPSFPLYIFLSIPNQRMSENWSEEWGHCYLHYKSVAARKMFTKVAILHWFILWWERQSERMATDSKKGQRPVELNECKQEKARLLKRVTILLHWSTNCKTYKYNFILFRGQVQGYWMSFTKEEVSERVCWQQHIHYLSLAMEATEFSAHLVSKAG